MLTIEIPQEFRRLFDNDWREAAIYGGRYSLKSHTVARYLLIMARQAKTRVACFREFQNSISESSHQLLKDLILKYELDDFEVTHNSIINKINGSDFLFKGLWNNDQSIKSIEGIDIAWCFIAGTKVDDKNIEDIRVGDLVTSYDHNKKEFEYRKVLRTTKRKAPRVFYRLSTQYGANCIIATEEHPIFVKGKGYVPIVNIKQGDIVYEKVELARNGGMFRWLRGRNSDKYTQQTAEVCKKWRDILLGLRKEKIVRKNETEQSDVKRGISEENERFIEKNKSQTDSLWRKWARIYNRSKYSLREIGAWVVERVSRIYWGKKESKQSSDELQDGLSKCLLYASDRVRWVCSQRDKIKNGGRKERYIFEERRVDSVEVQEQRDIKQLRLSDEGNYVYNLEVEINNNFFADDLLVHNCEEAQSISNKSLEVLTPTVRKPNSKIIYTYNRLFEDDPVHTRLVVEGRPDSLLINVNYDIALKYGFIPDVIIKEIEDDKLKRPALYSHKWLGKPLGSDRKIYKDWQIIDEIPHEARLSRRGLDFGYSVDPTAIEDIYEYNGGFIIDEICYQKGLSNKSIADLLNSLDGSILTVCDSAEPKSIQELRDYGINAVGSTKGQGSVFQGIQFVQAQKISITKRSLKTLKAYRHYMLAEDRNGKVLNIPDDSIHEWTNPMDAIRYGLSTYKKDTDTNNYEQSARDYLNKPLVNHEDLWYNAINSYGDH